MTIKLSGIRKNSNLYEDFEIEIDRLEDILIENIRGNLDSYEEKMEDIRYKIECDLEEEYDCSKDDLFLDLEEENYTLKNRLDDLEDESFELKEQIKDLEAEIKDLNKNV